MTPAARPRYAFVRHPDERLGREQPRHLIRPDQGRRVTLCGRPVRWDWDTTTPLTHDCGSCAAVARAGHVAPVLR